MGFKEIAAIVAELAKLATMIFGQSNSPEMVTAKLNEVHQILVDHNAALAAVIQDPSKSKAEKDRALEEMRLADS